MNDDAALTQLLETMFARYHYDFRHYARASMRRRLDQAMSKLREHSFDSLDARLRRDPEAFGALLPYLTLQVSDLFRDPGYFRQFREEIVPVLRTYPSRRLWVAGCSTGEEAYSFAIVLREEGLLDTTQIYATDISADSLRAAEAGVYAVDRVQTFTDNHRRSGAKVSLSEHYTAAYGAIAFARGLRDKILFADHSLATDTVFAEVQVVSCRNVLIYFDRALQDRALTLFRDALCRRGFLGLGPRESVQFSAVRRELAELPGDQRWYQKEEP